MQLRRPDPADHTGDALLRYVLGSVEVTAPEDLILQAASPAAHVGWPEWFEQALPALGLRSTRFHATVAEASALARPDMPLIAFIDTPVPTWVVLDGSRWQRVHAWSPSTILPGGWLAPEVLAARIGASGDLLWVRAEAALPATALMPRRAAGAPITPFERLRGLLYAERSAIGVIVIYAMAVGVLSLATPLAIQVMINWLAFGALVQPLIVVAGMLMVCLVLAVCVRATQRYAVEILQRRIFVRSVTDLGARLSRVRIEALDRNHGPELANRFFDVLTVQKAMSTLLVDGLAAALQAGVGLLLLAVYHPYLLVFDIVVIVLAAAALLPFLPAAERTAIEESKDKYAVAAWLEELARHPLVFKLGGLGLAESRLEGLNRAYLGSRSRHFRVFFSQYIGMQSVQVFVQVALLLTCGWLVLEGELTLGQLVAAEFIVTAALSGLAKFAEKLETIYDLLAGVDKLGVLFDLPHERTHGVWTPEAQQPGAALSVRGVNFGFDDAHPPVLSDASAEVPAGARVGIFGRPGSGKSLLADVLVGLRHPLTGTVWRDGIPLSQRLPDQVFAETLLLRSDGLLHGTVLDNVSLGRPEVDEQSVWAALEVVGLADAVGSMPRGLRTELSPKGAPLSQSQVRQLLLARTVVCAPRLLLVDGLLDGLVPETRDRILGVLLELPVSTTLVVLTEEHAIANKLDTVLELHEGGLNARPRLSTV